MDFYASAPPSHGRRLHARGHCKFCHLVHCGLDAGLEEQKEEQQCGMRLFLCSEECSVHDTRYVHTLVRHIDQSLDCKVVSRLQIGVCFMWLELTDGMARMATWYGTA